VALRLAAESLQQNRLEVHLHPRVCEVTLLTFGRSDQAAIPVEIDCAKQATRHGCLLPVFEIKVFEVNDVVPGRRGARRRFCDLVQNEVQLVGVVRIWRCVDMIEVGDSVVVKDSQDSAAVGASKTLLRVVQEEQSKIRAELDAAKPCLRAELKKVELRTVIVYLGGALQVVKTGGGKLSGR